MIDKIATSAVYVSDQEEAIRFWVEQVGFERRRDHPMGPEARWVEMAPQGADSCIVIYPKSMMEDWAERKPSLVLVRVAGEAAVKFAGGEGALLAPRAVERRTRSAGHIR